MGTPFPVVPLNSPFPRDNPMWCLVLTTENLTFFGEFSGMFVYAFEKISMIQKNNAKKNKQKNGLFTKTDN